ncbi:fumarylacetoacetate hydrolase family protein [Arthrobacter caoxuetaonis]|uniref:Fumarylacetoacetate hydrolase family protein n=1 Tax=Arthrobacter caoxuetaonis TaxID=2886935 RepID=A0A9X1SC86_9MICC|nr:fumarylacetoacetate hydrolase family protein [Arthrobacter caoxuetaonis]MCC3283268.1 fumarylacetoacetate hydrolase family protein [Arthrobacter caoxuetaonis]MCC3298390.1 fumarylacetoacetate hydrolase family protein [Arthrobacter caoxuetaonis]USQ57594.1 fumarylacetoacetate hydrolase family protein [Arthrobacter caoxuetaonis]
MVKVARWNDGGEVRSGFIHGDRAYPLAAGMTTNDLLSAGLEETLRLSELTLAAGAGGQTGESAPKPVDAVTLLAPLVPAAVRDFVAFEEHVEGMRISIEGAPGVMEEWYQAPTFYFTNPHTIRGTGEEIPIPAGCSQLDFETEVAAVIGRVPGSAGSNLTAEQAHRHIFGYTIFNDWSARDLQRREMKVSLGPCKGKDFAGTLGPWIVTADEFEDRHDAEGFLSLEMSVEVNGIRVGKDLLSNMGWPFAELVAYASQDSRVVPGDVLGSGTCGSGCLAELWGRNGAQTPPPLQTGDRVVMAVDGIGTITNTVGEQRDASTLVRARSRPRLRRSYGLVAGG